MFYEQIKNIDFQEISSRIVNADVREEKVFSILYKAERFERLGSDELMILLNPKTWELYKDAIQKMAHNIAVQRHGHTIRFYAPLYVSNECTNGCTYCGFNKNNNVNRITLNKDDVIKEAEAIKKLGIEHLLIVAGECPQTVGTEYLSNVANNLGGMFSSLSVEVAPMGEKEYKVLFQNNVDGVICYQETYSSKMYKECHKFGPKTNMEKRLDTLDRAGASGMRFLGVGALLGLCDFRAEAFFLGLHARYLEKKYWRSQVSVSFPRIRPSESGFNVPNPVSDVDLLQMIAVLRLYLPDSNLLLSTREDQSFRDTAVFYGINQMSGGSKTNPLGYSGSFSKNAEQFKISDERTPQEIATKLSSLGYDPVFKDWDRGFRSDTNQHSSAMKSKLSKEQKMKIFKTAGLYLVSSSSLSARPTVETINDFLDAGGRLFQLREKMWTRDQFLEAGKKLRILADNFNALFVLNDDPALAIELNADGVHLGQDDMNVSEARKILGDKYIIGVSTHNIKEVIKAIKDGADYINIGPVFPTNTKPGIKNISMQEIEEMVKHARVPFTFMGGITTSNLNQLLKFCPSALGMITEVTMAKDVKSKVSDILKSIGK